MQMTTWNYLKILAAVALAGALLAGVFAFRTPDRYVSTAVVRITPAGQGDNDRQMALDRLVELQQEVLSRTSLAQIIQEPALNLYPEDRQKMPLDDVVENMRNKAIRIQLAPAQNGGVPAFVISFEYPDKFKAQAVVRKLVNSFFTQNNLERGNQAPPAAEILKVLDPASLPQRRLGPNRPMMVAAGLLGGAVLGLLAVLAWRGAARAAKDKTAWNSEAGGGRGPGGRAGGDGVCLPHTGPIRFKAVMRLIPAGQGDNDRQRALDRLVELQQKVLSRESLGEIITQPAFDLYREDRKRMPLENVVEDMRNKALRIQLMQTQGGSVPAFSISCEYPDNLKAQAVVRELVSRFSQQNVAIQMAQGPSAEEQLEVLDPASLPARPLAPNRPMIVTVGLFGGAVLGLSAVLVWRVGRSSTLHSQKT